MPLVQKCTLFNVNYLARPGKTLSNMLMAIFNGIYFLFLIREGTFFIGGGEGRGFGGEGS